MPETQITMHAFYSSLNIPRSSGDTECITIMGTCALGAICMKNKLIS